MAITKIRQDQIKGLVDELSAIKEQIKTFKSPVDLIQNLPIEGNNDGDLRVCLEDDNIYIWSEDNKEWALSSGKNSFSVKTSNATVATDNQKEIEINISVEDGNELSSDTINVYLNGLMMDKQSYEIKSLNDKIIINWVDSEPLLTGDILLVQYFEIEMSGGSGGSSNTYSKVEIDEKIDNVKNNSAKSIMLNNTKYDTVDGTITLPTYPTNLPANGGNADTVNGLTVETAVPANAKFTDTIYTHPATHSIAEINGLQGELDSLKLSASNGKTTIAKAITGKGIATSATATFEQMANNIKNIEIGVNREIAAKIIFEALKQVGSQTELNDLISEYDKLKIISDTEYDEPSITIDCTINNCYMTLLTGLYLWDPIPSNLKYKVLFSGALLVYGEPYSEFSVISGEGVSHEYTFNF